MTTEEAIRELEGLLLECDHPEARLAMDVIRNKLDLVTEERDRLVEAWPTIGGVGIVYENMADSWTRMLQTEDGGLPLFAIHATREEAVRAAAGLDAMEGQS